MIPLYCPLCCDQPFDDQASLYFHLRGVRNNLFCPICSEKFVSLEVLVSHLAKRCPGPESPLLAKRKCLAKINEDPMLLEKKPKLTPGPVQLNVGCHTPDDCKVGQPSNQYVKSIPYPLRKKLPNNISAVVMKSPDCTQLNTKPQVPSCLENGTPLKDVLSPKLGESPSTDPCLAKKIVPFKRQVRCVWDSNEDCEIQDSSVNTTASIPLNRAVNLKAFNQTPVPQLKTQRILVKNSGQKQPVLATGVVKRSAVFLTNEQLNLVASSGKGSEVKCLPSKIILSNPPNSAISHPKAMKPLKTPLKPSPIVLPDTPKTPNSNVSDNESDFSFDTYVDNDDAVSSKSTNDSPEKTTEAKKQESKKGKSLQNGMSFPKGKSKEAAKKPTVDGKEKDVHKSTTPQVVPKKTETEDAKDGKGDDKNGTVEEEYTCSACNIRFTSIYEHIKQYHNGEEVVVEVPEEELKEEVRAYQHGQESSNSKSNETIVVNKETPKGLNTATLKNEVSSTNKLVSAPNKGLSNKSITPSKTSKKPKQTNNRKSDGNGTHKPDSSNRKSEGDKTIKQDPSPGTVSPKVNRSKGKWVLTEKSGRRAYYQYLYNPNKNQLLMNEMKTNKNAHPLYGSTIQTLFENPKINVIEITNKPNTPYFTDRIVNLKNPIPMYVTSRFVKSEREEMLGGKASYIIANSIPACDRTAVPKESKVIAVMKVLLASDKKLTMENIVFKEKPVNEFMIPFLEDAVNWPKLPLLEGAKMLMWRCTKCLSTTWKFPLTKDSHCCFSCHLCHKPFTGTQALRAHMALHKKDQERLCVECHKGFAQNATTTSDLVQCFECHLYVKRETMSAHKSLHTKEPDHKFTCSACESVFPLVEKAKVKEKEEQTRRVRLVAKHGCGECDKKFHSLTALAYHGLDHKQTALQYPCSYCPKKFLCQKEQCPSKAGKRKPSVYIQKVWHEKIHTRKRLHRCAGCPKTFRSEWHFREHTAAAHKYEVTTRAAPPIFSCDRCKQTFSNEGLLAAHTASRHAVKPCAPGDEANCSEGHH